MQAFAYRHLVPSRELDVQVNSRFMGRTTLRIKDDLPLIIPAGGTATVHVGGVGPNFTNRFDLELSEPPEGLSIRRVGSDPGGMEIELSADARCKSGLRDNLIVNVLPVAAAESAKPGKPRPNRQRQPLTVLPALPIEITPPIPTK